MLELAVVLFALLVNALLFYRPIRAALRRMSGAGPAGWEGDR